MLDRNRCSQNRIGCNEERSKSNTSSSKHHQFDEDKLWLFLKRRGYSSGFNRWFSRDEDIISVRIGGRRAVVVVRIKQMCHDVLFTAAH